MHVIYKAQPSQESDFGGERKLERQGEREGEKRESELSPSMCMAPDALEYDPGPHRLQVATLEAPDIAVQQSNRFWQRK